MPSVRLRTKELSALGEAAERAKTLAHPGRLRMVQILLQREYTVSDLGEACKLPSALASEHLRLMQRCRFSHQKEVGTEGVLPVFRNPFEEHSEVC